MAYKPIFQLSFVSLPHNGQRIVVTPRLKDNTVVADALGYSLPNQPDRIYYIYARFRSRTEVYKGRITSIFNAWFMMTPVYMNDLVKYDFLYERDHDAQLHKRAVGIMYELI